MSILREFDLEVNEKEIIRLLGFKNSIPDEETLEAIRSEIKNSSNYLVPEIAYEKIFIKEKNKDRVVLENNVVLEGKFIAGKLAKCQFVIVLVSTIGSGIDDNISRKYEEGDYLGAMIVDNIGTTALNHINKFFWNRMVEDIKHSALGITSRLSPGDTAMPVEEQTKLFRCLENNALNVKLTESYMMLPLKSTSAIYGFGEDIGITRLKHVCSECSMKNCAYRMMNEVNIIVNHEGQKTTLKAGVGSNLLEVLRSNGILIQSPCGGKKTCGKCRVEVVSGLEAAKAYNTKHLSREEYDRGIRLSCDIDISSDMEIRTLRDTGAMEIMSAGVEKPVEVNPAVMKKHVVLSKPSISDQRDDYKRLSDGLGINDLMIPYDKLLHISREIRDSEFDFTAAVFDRELLHIEKGDTTPQSYGIAIDIGTTTIAGYLVDLTNGRTLEIQSQINKQASYGADVISRINYTIEKESGGKVLKQSIIAQINEIIQKLADRTGIDSRKLYNAVIVGNTTMIHFLLGLNAEGIAVAPFIPVITAGLNLKARELGINMEGYISIMPGISGYVGSDITAGILSSGMMESDKYSILLDLGTNGEIALGNRDRVVACSTAAGPAFEGANIKCGIGGIKGAISRVKLENENIYETIGGAKACGICGSGVLDIVSEFIKVGIIDDTGRMVDGDELDNEEFNKRLSFDENSNIKEFVIEEAANNSRIVFTQKDVREVQLAKAAIRAGIEVLLKELKLSFKDIDKVYIGGGFGNFMNIESAVNIGLLPKELLGRIVSIGNCAGTGAKQYLLSQGKRRETEEIIEKASYIELSGRKDFQDHYIDAMMF